MPTSRKTTKAALAAAAAMPSIPKELIDQFVTGPMSAEAVNAASMAFKKALIERALGAELSHHLGYLPFEANAAHLFFQLVSRRYERGSILVTSNRSVSEWGGVFGDAVVATAILDRMLHHSHVITIRGDSSRLRTKRRSGLVNQAGANPQPAIN
ncbi:MAG: ATP-binding protein [Betaproteobacteria bacterium]